MAYKAKVDETNVAVGSVVYLQKLHCHEIELSCSRPSCHCKGALMNPLAYGHPALVLGISDQRWCGSEAMALIAVISSNNRPTKNTPTMAIQGVGTAPIPVNDPRNLIYLDAPGEFRHNTYLQIDHCYWTSLRKLRQFGDVAFGTRLTKESYDRTMGLYGMSPCQFIPTPLLEIGMCRDPGFNVPVAGTL